MDSAVKQDLQRFVDTWRAAGAALQDQRMNELSRLTDEQARSRTLDLFALWHPSEHDDLGSELVEQQRVFRLWRERRRRSR